MTGACAGKETPPIEPARLTDQIPRVDNDTTARCETQRQIAAQNSWFASLKAGRAVVYKSDCDLKAKAKSAPKSGPAQVAAAPKTS